MPDPAARELKTLCLREPALTLAVAESITGGRIQSAVTAMPGCSAYFLGGITAYSLDQKVRLLGVGRAAAGRVNCVSAEVAVQMARGVAKALGAGIALATTGYAEPNLARGVEAPFAFWAIAHRLTARRWHVATGRVVCPGMKRVDVQDAVAQAALAELVTYLKSRH